MAQNEPTRRNPHPVEIPDRLYFRIGDVAKLCEVPTYVLRFWETEFPQLKPNKGGTGQRLYRRKDVEMALRVKRLLYDEGYTIPGARQALQETRANPESPLLASADALPPLSLSDLRSLHLLRKELQSLHLLLSRPSPVAKSSTVQSIRGPRPALTLTPRPLRPTMDDLFDPPPSENQLSEV